MRWKNENTLVLPLKCDEVLKNLANEAMQAQDACNLCALSQSFAKAMKALVEHPQSTGTDWVNQHPITKLWLSKFEHLAKLEQGPNNCWFPCSELEDGHDTEMEIEVDYADLPYWKTEVPA